MAPAPTTHRVPPRRVVSYARAGGGGLADDLEDVVEALARGDPAAWRRRVPPGRRPRWRRTRSAASRREATGSTATIWAAPLSRAPWIAEMPTPPQPMTATDEPASTSAVLRAAPSPVVTPQPMSAAMSKGTSSGIGTAQPASTTTSSAKVPVPAKPKTSPPGRLKLGVPAFMNPARHSWVWPRLQDGTAAAGGQPAHQRPGRPGFKSGDAVADVEDLAGALVAGDEGRGLRQHPAHRGEVRVAQPGGPDPDPDLAGAEAHRLDVVEDFELVLADLVQYGCAHGAAPLVRTSVADCHGWLDGSVVLDDGVGEDRARRPARRR